MVRSISLLNGGTTIVDDADFEAVCQFPWRRNSKGYAMFSYTENGKRRETYLHRMIMHARPGEVVDHLDHDRLNNTRANLRCCTVQENLRYRRRFSNNDCGFKGVTAWRGRWLARIYVNDHAVRLGIYDDLKTAAQAYDVAARLLFHGFAAFNLPDSPAPSRLQNEIFTKLRHNQRDDVQQLLRRSPEWQTSNFGRSANRSRT